MISRDLDGASRKDVYRILSSLVIPRPIAWILTQGREGTSNLAPFSSFMGIFNPPALAVAFGRKSDGSLKDTHRNLRDTGEAVVHLADGTLLEALHATGEELPYGVSEAVRLGLETLPSDRVRPPRLAAAPVALECRLRQELVLDARCDLVLLDVLRAHAAERIWNAELDCADGGMWDPVARLGSLGGPNYVLPGERRTLHKPKRP
ncbi:MAG: flavin reductase family protein [Acidobacteriota bacterium]